MSAQRTMSATEEARLHADWIGRAAAGSVARSNTVVTAQVNNALCILRSVAETMPTDCRADADAAIDEIADLMRRMVRGGP